MEYFLLYVLPYLLVYFDHLLLSVWMNGYLFLTWVKIQHDIYFLAHIVPGLGSLSLDSCVSYTPSFNDDFLVSNFTPEGEHRHDSELRSN